MPLDWYKKQATVVDRHLWLPEFVAARIATVLTVATLSGTSAHCLPITLFGDIHSQVVDSVHPAPQT